MTPGPTEEETFLWALALVQDTLMEHYLFHMDNDIEREKLHTAWTVLTAALVETLHTAREQSQLEKMDVEKETIH